MLQSVLATGPPFGPRAKHRSRSFWMLQSKPVGRDSGENSKLDIECRFVFKLKGKKPGIPIAVIIEQSPIASFVLTVTLQRHQQSKWNDQALIENIKLIVGTNAFNNYVQYILQINCMHKSLFSCKDIAK